MRPSLPLFVLSFVLLVPACSDTGATTTDPKKAQEETTRTTNKITQILQSVKDSESAKKARTELQQVADQIETKVAALKQSWKSPKDAAKDWLEKGKAALSTESRQAFAQARQEFERIEREPQWNQELKAAIEQIKAAIAGL